MRTTTRVLAAVAAVAAAVTVGPMPAAANADPDIDFANQLHGFGIYGQRDYNAWLGKIACKRIDRGVDSDAYASANFVERNLPQNTTTAQAWQFLGAAISTYCPGNVGLLQAAAR